jgi:putative sigma-54 modulation protein
MQILISAKDFPLTPSIKTYAEEKLNRLGRFWSGLVRMHLELSKNRHHRHGDVVVSHAWIEAPGNDIRCRVTATDIYESIDMLSAKLERQVVKAKERMRHQ